MTTDTISAAFFEQMYQSSADPWNFAGSAYELARYEATLAALSHRRYGAAFEPGCSVGVLTERLAGVCDSVEAIDISAEAVNRAQARCHALGNVALAKASLADYEPNDELDLMVFSEVGYYFHEGDLVPLVLRLVSHLRPTGTLLAVHWLGHSEDHLLHGDRVHEILLAAPGLTHELSERHEVPGRQAGFRLDRWVRA